MIMNSFRFRQRSHWQTRYGHLEAVRVLLARGADVDWVPAEGGVSALYVAAYNGHLDLTEELVSTTP